ncbi:hypothetical protein [Streptomyces buecherae]|uniref:hypothetical protein n=1 Tax=Streptomyces buecherae TaxID=2763006 RepID=UPI003669EBA0
MEYADLEGDEDDGEARVTVRVPVGTRLALTSVLERHRVWTQQLRARHQARLKTIAPAQRVLLRGEQHQELHTLRSQGELLDTRDVLVAFGLRQEV